MSKHKSHGKDKKKGSQLVIRIDKAERDAFVTRCDQMDTSAAREIRRFMRDWLATHAPENSAAEVQAEDVATPPKNTEPSLPVDAALPQNDGDLDTSAVTSGRAKRKQKSIPLK